MESMGKGMKKRLKVGVFVGSGLAVAMFSGCATTHDSGSSLIPMDRPTSTERFNIDISKVFGCMGCCQFGVTFAHRTGIELSIKPCSDPHKKALFRQAPHTRAS